MKKTQGRFVPVGISLDFDSEGQIVGHSMKWRWEGPVQPMVVGTVRTEPLVYGTPTDSHVVRFPSKPKGESK